MSKEAAARPETQGPATARSVASRRVSTTPGVDGPAARAVLDRYHADLARYRRRVLGTRVGVGVIVLWALVSAVIAPGLTASTGNNLPWLILSVPVALAAIIYLLRMRVVDGLGAKGEPAFPTAMLELAREQDAAAAKPRAFGAIPETMRVYNPENW